MFITITNYEKVFDLFKILFIIKAQSLLHAKRFIIIFFFLGIFFFDSFANEILISQPSLSQLALVLNIRVFSILALIFCSLIALIYFFLPLPIVLAFLTYWGSQIWRSLTNYFAGNGVIYHNHLFNLSVIRPEQEPPVSKKPIDLVYDLND